MRAARGVLSRAGVLAALGALVLTGCGIRPTPGPVAAGPAPHGAAGQSPSQTGATVPSDHIIYFILQGRLAPVARTTFVNLDTQSLIRELVAGPNQTEELAGYTSSVPSYLTVLAPQPDDAADVVRLGDAGTTARTLSSTAYQQIACTLRRSVLNIAVTHIHLRSGQVLARTCELKDALRTEPSGDMAGD
jgi:hypothetical protein